MDPIQLWNYGLPTGLLLLIGWGGYKAAVWTGTNVILPWVQAHIDLANTASESIKSQAATLKAIQETTVQLPQTIAPVVAQVCKYPLPTVGS